MSIKRFLRGLRLLLLRDVSVLVVLVLIALLIAGLYGAMFGISRGLGIGSPEAWGQFGDYFGGIVNPAIGLATVFLIIRTLAVTRQEAKETRQELTEQTKQLREQVQHLQSERSLAEVKQRLDGVLREWNVEMDEDIGPLPIALSNGEIAVRVHQDQTVRDVIFVDRLADHFAAVPADRKKIDVYRLWNARFASCLRLLDELDQYVNEYRALVSDPNGAKYYCRRIQIPLRLFRAVGIVGGKEFSGLNVGITAREYCEN